MCVEIGLTLIQVFPGIDIERDIRRNASLRIFFPDDDVKNVKTVDRSVVTGQGFKLSIRAKAKI